MKYWSEWGRWCTKGVSGPYGVSLEIYKMGVVDVFPVYTFQCGRWY